MSSIARNPESKQDSTEPQPATEENFFSTIFDLIKLIFKRQDKRNDQEPNHNYGQINR